MLNILIIHTHAIINHDLSTCHMVLRCVNTCHMANLDLSTTQRWTCLWDLARGVPSASLLEELTYGQDVEGASGPTPCSGCVKHHCLG
jgi:hypothetical protein